MLKNLKNKIMQLKKSKTNLRVVNLTHTDLDGVGCSILLRVTFGNKNVKTILCNYNNVDERVLKVVDEHNSYDLIVISDISVSKEVATELNKIKDKVVLVDHHTSDNPKKLMKFDFAFVNTHYNNRETCGTELVYYLLEDILENSSIARYDSLENLSDFVESVRRYDTWLWTSEYKSDKYPVMLDTLTEIYGLFDFMDLMEKRLSIATPYITDEDWLLCEIEEKRKQRFFAQKSKTIDVVYKWGYKVGVVFADSYVSELAEYIGKNDTTLEIVIIITSSSISYRTTKDYVDVSKIAALYNGGGRQQTAGSRINIELKKSIIDLIFN